MTQKSEPGKPRFMTQAEVARELGISATAARQLIVVDREMVAVTLRDGGRIRTTRESFEEYCARRLAHGAEQFGRAS